VLRALVVPFLRKAVKKGLEMTWVVIANRASFLYLYNEMDWAIGGQGEKNVEILRPVAVVVGNHRFW